MGLPSATHKGGALDSCRLLSAGPRVGLLLVLALASALNAWAQGSAAGSSLVVDIKRLSEQLEQLAVFSDTPGEVTRVLWSAKDMASRRFVRKVMVDAGLEVHEDAVGNIFGRWLGTDPKLPGVATGSHIDAIPNSGKYDGVVGVLGAIEALTALKGTGFVPKRSIDVVMFTAEEPTRFGISCLGSRLMAADAKLREKLPMLADSEGVSFADAAAAAGHPGVLEDLDSVVLTGANYSAFVELHIEQGPILENEGINIGIVTAIAAPAALRVEFSGEGGHAGGRLMAGRTDAGLAAAELALAVEKFVLESGSEDTVGTTGFFQVLPNAVNSIPRTARIEIDIRDIDGDRRDIVVSKVNESAHAIAERRGVNMTLDVINQDPPALAGDAVIKAVQDTATALGLSSKLMVSRAYHDSLFMARLFPTSMIFIPCLEGFSHRPEEFASPEDIQNGVSVLALSLAKLSSGEVALGGEAKKKGWFF